MMKGIAILAMLCHHLYGCPPDGVEPYTGVLAWLGVLGKVCVALFLFCSGYGLAANYKPISIKDDLKFMGRRLIKFYLNYWVIFLIFVPITIFAFHRPLSAAYGDNYIWWHLILDIFGLQGWNSFNITWWFNTLIIILYALFPILFKLICIKPWLAVLIGMSVMRYASHIPYDEIGLCTWQFPFVLGIVWNLYENKGARVQEWFADHKGIAIIASICLLIATVIVRMYPIIPHWNGMRIDGFVACAVALIVVTTLRKCKYMTVAFSFLGRHSVNIYMLHTFYNAYWFDGWLYSCEWLRGGANCAILLLLCLSASIMLEYMKERIGFYKFIKYITHQT